MKNILFAFLIIAPICHAKDIVAVPACDDSIATNHEQVLKLPQPHLTNFKHYCFTDRSGSYDLFLNEKQDKPYDNDLLSTAIEAKLYKRSSTTESILVSSFQDQKNPNEIGVNFRSKLTELSDLDNDGAIDPMVVYKFVDPLQDATADKAYSGRLKIVMFYKGQKVVIRAMTGALDPQRSTTANDQFFKLPVKLQKHLIAKMKKMYDDGIFGFDNSNNFIPKTEVK